MIIYSSKIDIVHEEQQMQIIKDNKPTDKERKHPTLLCRELLFFMNKLIRERTQNMCLSTPENLFSANFYGFKDGYTKSSARSFLWLITDQSKLKYAD